MLMPGALLLQVFGMSLKPYVPDFTTAFEHFCIHPGGKAVIEEVSKQLKLRPEQSLPMLVPFERYGNTSSSSTWCALLSYLDYFYQYYNILETCWEPPEAY